MKVSIAMKKDNELLCPIPECQHSFERGKTGWFQHVARVENHPKYHPDITSHNLRATFFRKDFPAFFEENGEKRITLTPSALPAAPSAPPTDALTALRMALDIALLSGDINASQGIAALIASLATAAPRTVSGIRKAAG